MNLSQLVLLAHKHLVENLPEGLLVLDPDDCVADINPPAIKLLSITRSSCVGEKFETLTQALAGLKDIQQGTLLVQAGEHGEVSLALEVNTLTQDERFVGRLVVIRDITPQKSAEVEQAAAGERAVALDEITFAQMEQLVTSDTLTGLYNRRYLFSLTQIELDQSLRYQHPLSAIMMDIDHFKQVNATYGNPAGDQVLQAMADLCRKSFRKVDTVGRYGGDEFLIILPETSAASALIAAERLRSRISQADIETQAARLQVTVSMGIASLETAAALETLVEQADQALAAAKQAGGNLTKVYPNL